MAQFVESLPVMPKGLGSIPSLREGGVSQATCFYQNGTSAKYLSDLSERFILSQTQRVYLHPIFCLKNWDLDLGGLWPA